MSDIADRASGKIRVADITLAQLSRGLYRSNATVFKELINNAYDADATEVRVNTNFPAFDYISIVDNGSGMPLESFKKHFADDGIGSSSKRRGNVNETEIHKRPIIGRLGIGMMAIGQLCHSFEVESHYINEKGKKLAFRGEIVLTNENIPDLLSEINKPTSKGKEIDVGEWSFEKIDFEQDKKGFRIYSNDVRGTFRREMRESYETLDEFRNVPFSLKNIISILYNSRSVRDCKAYLETIWELCTLCPLPYYDNEKSPVSWNQNAKIEILDSNFSSFIGKRQSDLLGYNFELHFDGILLNKLIQLPSVEDITSRVYYFEFDQEIFDSRLKFSGYVFSQVSRAIRPFELNGIQVRLRNVGIGGYDATFMKYYKQVETIRSKWVSGEIFVDAGLEAALNIDRDSFNEHEEHYKSLQKYIHEVLDKVFDETNKAAMQKREIVKETKLSTQSNRLKDYVITASKGKFQLKEDKNIHKSLEIDNKKGVITINNSIQEIRSNKADQLYKIIEIAYHISRAPKSEEERHNTFMELVKKALKEII
ncbi:MAG: ATP-binding protein [Sphingobacteriales bacterium]|nr:ATP-binding protein [Sphingobacteriales bacterium]